MRILSPTGRLFKISGADAYVEADYELNGVRHLVKDVASDMSMKPTGIKFHIKCKDKFTNQYVYIGNLTSEKVKEIMQVILREKCYDLSKLSYQHRKAFEEYVLDGGTSLPYFEEQIFEHMGIINYRPRFPMSEEDE